MKNLDSVMRERFQRQQQDESRIRKQEIKELDRMKAAAYAHAPFEADSIPAKEREIEKQLARFGLRRGIDYEITKG